MPTAPCLLAGRSGRTSHTVRLYPETSTTAAASALTLTELTDDGDAKPLAFYSFDADTALSGIHKVVVLDASGTAVGTFWVKLDGTTSQKLCHDDPSALKLGASAIAAEVSAIILANAAQHASALKGQRSDIRGDSWSLTFTVTGNVSASDDWLFSLKQDRSSADTAADLRVTATGGLERINGDTAAAAGLTTGHAEIAAAYDGGEDETTITVTVDSEATALLDANDSAEDSAIPEYLEPRSAQVERLKRKYHYDFAEYEAGGSEDLTREDGLFTVYADVTQKTN